MLTFLAIFTFNLLLVSSIQSNEALSLLQFNLETLTSIVEELNSRINAENIAKINTIEAWTKFFDKGAVEKIEQAIKETPSEKNNILKAVKSAIDNTLGHAMTLDIVDYDNLQPDIPISEDDDIMRIFQVFRNRLTDFYNETIGVMFNMHIDPSTGGGPSARSTIQIAPLWKLIDKQFPGFHDIIIRGFTKNHGLEALDKLKIALAKFNFRKDISSKVKAAFDTTETFLGHTSSVVQTAFKAYRSSLNPLNSSGPNIEFISKQDAQQALTDLQDLETRYHMNDFRTFKLTDFENEKVAEKARKTYKILSKLAHPDKNKGNDADFKELTGAWETLYTKYPLLRVTSREEVQQKVLDPVPQKPYAGLAGTEGLD